MSEATSINTKVQQIHAKMNQFSPQLHEWVRQTRADLHAQLEINIDMNKEYDNRMGNYSRLRGDWTLRYMQAIEQALEYEQKLKSLNLELAQLNQSSDQICEDIKCIKKLKAELGSKLNELKFEQQRAKQQLTSQIHQLKCLVAKFAIFLGLELTPTELLSENDPYLIQHFAQQRGAMHTNNRIDPNNNNVSPAQLDPTGEGIFIRYTSLTPQLSFVLYPSPVCVTNISLALPNLHILEHNLIQTANLHAFFVKLYFLHKETYPNK